MRVESKSNAGRGASLNAKLTLTGVALAGCSVASIVGLNQALRREAGVVILWLGWLSLGLIVGSCLCLSLAVAGFFQKKKGNTASPVGKKLERGGYLAKYSLADKFVALGIAVASAALGTFFVVRSAGLGSISIAVALVVWAVFYLIQVTLTEVLFTDHGLVARRPFQGKVFKSYADVKRITGKPGTVKLEFFNGQTVKLHTGLGEADIVISYLRRHCLERLEIE